MAEFKFPCPRCGQNIQCDTGYSGTQINCPACQQAIVVPQAPVPFAAPVPPPAAASPAIRRGTPALAAGRESSGAPVRTKSRTLRNVLLIAAVALVLAGLGLGGWYGYSKIRMQSGRGQTFNIDFGPGRGSSKQVGPAAVGRDGDFWNGVAIGFNNDHTESGLKFADGQPSPIEVRLVNLGGGWGNEGKMGVKAPMLDSFNYPANNRGGNSQVILSHVPPGVYSLYLYGHGLQPLYYGDYAVSVADHDYGRKKTSSGADGAENTSWVEDSQYVRFPAVNMAAGENIEILIRPGGRITVSGGRIVSDAMICGLQLVPAD
jgi:hypothetical protein